LVWKIEIIDAAQDDLARLDKPIANRITKFLMQRLAQLDDPRSIGEALRGSELGTFWKYRVGDWRVIARIEDKTVRILVVRIGNRRSVYR